MAVSIRKNATWTHCSSATPRAQHPDVIGTRRLIKDLEEQKRQEIVARKKFAATNPGASVSNNPVYQQLKVSLAEAEANAASLRARVSEYEERYKRTTT